MYIYICIHTQYICVYIYIYVCMYIEPYPSEKYEFVRSSVRIMKFPIYGKIQHVPNDQLVVADSSNRNCKLWGVPGCGSTPRSSVSWL